MKTICVLLTITGFAASTLDAAPDVAAKGVLKINKPATPLQPVRKLSAAIVPVAPLHTTTPVRNATAASIGGLAQSSAKTSAAAVNGTGVKYKH